MQFYKIICKYSFYPNVLAVIKGKDANNAIIRFKRLSGYSGDVLAIKTTW